ncbi:MAG: N-acetyl-gamma-glutamyl-phosphate reductase [Deltaproteobacteria bacterium]|nr:N-acetyl-gamma-glutamyl-phosphate reductase [Candidatus Anaeroferrophillus wilburensis]MBN2888083.1 N-acetyl-gamma-glutamyl-phosphate reductase [Deltaproteobacteria bacterium]
MVRVAVVGASGYTGVELIRILSRHPQVELAVVTSRQYAGEEVAVVFPSLRGICSLVFCPNDYAAIKDQVDVVFTALPHKTAMEVVADFYEAGKKVIDLSADYRFTDVSLYESWYQEHSRKDLLAAAVYGLPELHREAISKADIVGNPGCYPTGAILALTPLFRQGMAAADQPVIIDAKSGTSGAGRGLATGSLYCEVNESFKAYKVGMHRHQPEIQEQVDRSFGGHSRILFVPHLVPINRGILSTIYVPLKNSYSSEDIKALYEDAYGGEFFVRLLPAGSLPTVAAVRGSNYCDMGMVLKPEEGLLVVLTAIDNLVKGAAGQAVQNMNIMLGFNEQAGLEAVPLAP